jgi:hypothetical protein
MLHWDFTITFGNVLTIASMAFLLLGINHRVSKWLDHFSIEHEILIRDYCERHDLRVNDLPTRFRTGGHNGK